MSEYNEEQYAVMRTAFLTAYPKIFTNIKNSIEIFSFMKELAIENNFSFSPSQFTNEMSIEIEARYKGVNNILNRYITKDTLIIEVAAGLSPRRIEYSSYNYAEIDLSPIIEIKHEIYKNIYPKFIDDLYSSDIKNIDELKSALKQIMNKKSFKNIIFLSEGLFWYLTKTDIQNITNELKESFKDINWIWITSDCPVNDKVDLNYRNVISNSAKVKKEKTFSDYDDFSNFFKNNEIENSRIKLSELLPYEQLSAAHLFSVREEDALRRIDTYTNIAILKCK